MRDAKSLLLLFVSLLLVLVSFVLIWTWGYRYYSKNDEYKANTRIVITDSNALANRIRDSLQIIYNETLHRLDTQLDSTLLNSDSLKAQLDLKLGEFFRLSHEITAILRNRNSGADFNVAKQKIGELQAKADELNDKNKIVENENKKLGGILDQLNETGKRPETNTQADRGSSVPGAFIASELKLSAIMADEDKEQETSAADQAKKLVGSFTVTNSNQVPNAEMLVVVLQPDGRVLKNSEWDAGSFTTQEGKKLYSYKLNFTYSRGEPKRLNFSLRADKYQKGNYTMQLYYNGLMIGKAVKTLS